MQVDQLLLPDDGDVPNHPRWPLILYRAAIGPARLAADERAFDSLFEANRWPVGFRNGIYAFTHFHSVTHEVLGIARGHARVQFGGEHGPVVDVVAGDAALLPAGTGHRRIEASADLLVIGAYPPGAHYDLLRPGEGDGPAIRRRIASVPRPHADPVGGASGPMLSLWSEAVGPSA